MEIMIKSAYSNMFVESKKCSYPAFRFSTIQQSKYQINSCMHPTHAIRAIPAVTSYFSRDHSLQGINLLPTNVQGYCTTCCRVM